jgi:hypothetical protein
MPANGPVLPGRQLLAVSAGYMNDLRERLGRPSWRLGALLMGIVIEITPGRRLVPGVDPRAHPHNAGRTDVLVTH